jgi:PAS domain S-box-containing protein
VGDRRPIRSGDPTAIAGALACLVIAGLDIALARSALFSPLLALGPFVSALRSGPGATALVAALATSLAVLLGTVDESVGSVDHTLALVLVIGAGLLATAAAAVREREARLNTELASAERRLEAILANLGEAVIVHAPDGSIVFANAAAARLTGLATPQQLMAATTDELAGRFVHLDEAGEPIEPAARASARALAGEEPEPMLVHRIEPATGREDWLLQKATPVRDADDRVTLAVSGVEDVTAIRRAERHQRFLAAAGKLVSSSLDVDATLEKTGARRSSHGSPPRTWRATPSTSAILRSCASSGSARSRSSRCAPASASSARSRWPRRCPSACWARPSWSWPPSSACARGSRWRTRACTPTARTSPPRCKTACCHRDCPSCPA